MSKRIIIIGAGPTGIGAAYRLYELGYENWMLYERHSYVGGHASSHTDEKGFVWDEGGHVIFSHYSYFDRFLDRMLGADYLEHERQSWIRILNTWVPYPFQNNIRYLPKEALLECLWGLVEANWNHRRDAENGHRAEPANFAEWTTTVFGEGIAKYFMRPYNFKVWGYPLEVMAKEWIAERVSTVDLRRVLQNVIYEQDDVSWGPNNKFKFPLYGGTGEIYRRAASLFPDRIRLNQTLVELDLVKRTVSFADGRGDRFDALVTTMPLDQLVSLLKPRQPQLEDEAARLQHNGIFTVGIGLEKRIETKWCWMYFPESNCPFYRVTFFHNYSPNNVPQGRVDKYSSLMCEISFSPFKPVARQEVLHQTLDGLIQCGLLEEADRPRIVSQYVRQSDYAYPIPTLGRDEALAQIQPFLMKHEIYSRGRFGAWLYEIGNMDHSVMQGVEAINRILFGEPETVFSNK